MGAITSVPLQLERLAPSQHRAAGEMLARAFHDDPLSVYLLPDPEKRGRLLAWMYERVIRYGAMYDGELPVTPGRLDGVALWLPPGLSHTPVLRLVRAGLALTPLKLGILAIRRFLAANEVEKLRARLAPEPHLYLWLIGVEPERQGQGIGSKLMEPMLRRADAEDLPCYLETHKEQNVAFYRAHGFEVVHSGSVPRGGPPYWCFKRKARRQR